jgi:hypothetical protein
MKKIALPLVMIASLATLVSCGQTGVTTPVVTTPTPTNVITGVVITPTTSVAPTALTRKETLSYDVPAPELKAPVEFDVTVTDGIITAATARTLATTPASKYNQDNFVKNVSAKVVGKKAKDLKVDAIGGASLTTLAFETFVHSF